MLAEQRASKDGLESENYKKLLDLLMQLDNKIKQTYQSVVSDIRQEFVGLMNANEQKRDNQGRENEERLQKQLGEIKDGVAARADIHELKREVESVMADKSQKADNNYQTLLEILSKLERDQDQKFTAYITDFKSQIPELLDSQRN